jgi:hypothetical protein
MQERHAENEAVPDGSLGAGKRVHRPLGFAKSARNRLSTAGAAFAGIRDDGRWWPCFLIEAHVTGRS